MFNENVEKYKDKVHNHEQSVIDGKIVVSELNDFINLHQEVNDVIDEYQSLYNETNEKEAQEKLESYLYEELDYLNLIKNLLDILAQYHQEKEITDSQTIHDEWKDVHLVIVSNNIKRSLNRIKLLKEQFPNEKKYEDLEQELQNKYSEIASDALNSCQKIINKSELIDEEEQENTAELKIDRQKLNQMELDDAIVYVEQIMHNIEQVKGKKYRVIVNGEHKQIFKKYKNRYMEYNVLLSQLKAKKEEEEEAIIDEIDNDLIDTIDHNSLEAVRTEINQLFANVFDNSEITTVMYFGEVVSICTSDLERFNELYQEEQKLRIQSLYENYSNALSNQGLSLENEKIAIKEKIHLVKNSWIKWDFLAMQTIALVSLYLEKENNEELKTNTAIAQLLNDAGFNNFQVNDLMDRLADFKQENRKDNTNEFENIISMSDHLDSILDYIFDLFDKADQDQYKDAEKISVNYFGGEYFILKSDKELYDKLYKEQEELRQKLNQSSIVDIEDIDERKNTLLQQIKMLKEYGVKGEALSVQINSLLSEYYQIEKRKRYSSLSAMTHLLEKQGYSKDEATSLAADAYDFIQMLNDLTKSNEEKMSVYNRIKNAFKSFGKTEEDEKLEKQEGIKDKINPIRKIAKKTISKVNETTSKFIARLPHQKGNFIAKVKSIKKPKNKELLRDNIKKRAVGAALTIGLGVVMVMGASKSNNSSRTTDVSNQITNESTIDNTNENNKIDFQNVLPNVVIDADLLDSEAENINNDNIFDAAQVGMQNEISSNDSITNVAEENTMSSVAAEDGLQVLEENILANTFTLKENAKIYTDMYKASAQVDQLKPYYPTDSVRDITGYAYSYNGNMMLLNENDPDFQAKKAALEANGAVLTAVRAENNVDQQGIEGYYNVNDIQMNGPSR